MKIVKYILSLCLVLGLLVNLTGCPQTAQGGEDNKAKGMVYYTFFDTVSYVYSYSDDSQAVFESNCSAVSEILGKYHKLFDIYYEYAGVTNLRTINKNAGGEPLTVEKELIDFLLYAKELYTLTNGEMNIMMGALLRPWHDCRTAAATDPANAAIPSDDIIAEAMNHIDFSSLEIDEENLTVRITDPKASIDVGALGKGYATEKAAEYLESKGVNSYVLNIGGNIRIIGTKADGSGWLTGIKDPKAPNAKYASYITIANTSCVTSGDYERFFNVDGQKYHHIIDKDTGLPASYFTSVTIITQDSGLADALSTALFCMSYEDGRALVDSLEGVDILWIENDGTLRMTDGYKALITDRQ